MKARRLFRFLQVLPWIGWIVATCGPRADAASIPGFLLRKEYHNIPGTLLDNLVNHPNFLKEPDVVGLNGLFLASSAQTERSAVDLRTWSVISFPFADQHGGTNGNWEVSRDGLTATQTVNANPSILLSDIVSSNSVIRGTFRVGSDGDDDIIGFVFGYQDPRHFYLFDWKQASQVSPEGYGFAEQGMSVKIVSTSSKLTPGDLWPTYPMDMTRVRLVYHNRTPYIDDAEYEFTLEFSPGRAVITVRRATYTVDLNRDGSGR